MPIGYKISILIKGYLRYKLKAKKTKIIRDILCLSLMPLGRKFPFNDKNKEVWYMVDR